MQIAMKKRWRLGESSMALRQLDCKINHLIGETFKRLNNSNKDDETVMRNLH